MSDIKASVILAEKIEDKSIINVIEKLDKKERNVIWMYLTIKANVKDNEELHIGFDIIRLDDDNTTEFGIELGEFVVGKTNDENKQRKIMEMAQRSSTKSEVVSEKSRSIFSYSEIFTIGQKFPPLPILNEGYYEFIVYEKQEHENYILDTFQFIVE